MHLVQLLAQSATTGPTTAPAPPPWAQVISSPMFVLAIGMLIFFVFMSKSKNSQEKQRKQMLDQLKRGDRVQTIGGILGNVIDASDDEVVVKVDETSNTKVTFTRNAIHRVIDKEKTDKK